MSDDNESLIIYLLFTEEFSVYKHLYGGVFFAKELPKTDSGKFAKTDLKKLILEGNMEIF